MSREVITAAPDTSVSEIAEILERNRIKRVPIVMHALASLRKEIAARPVAEPSCARRS